MEAVRIVEVGPRDGLQSIKTAVPTETKLELIEKLRNAGLQCIELTSVVRAKAVPQLADCSQVLSSALVKSWLQTETSLRLPVLVPNSKGLQIALDQGVKEVAVFVSATEGFSKANINCTVSQGIQRARDVATEAIARGVTVRGYVSCVFEDPFTGPTPMDAVHDAVKALLNMGCYEVSLGDTLGTGTPPIVSRLLEYLRSRGIDLSCLAGHFHDTYGQAVANVWEAYRCGIRTFDSSVAGLGGCPFAPGAKGNVATEDIVYLFQQAGISTGVDLPRLTEVGAWISQQLQKPNDSRAGAALTANASKKHPTGSSGSLVKMKVPRSPARETDHDLLGRSSANGKGMLSTPKHGNFLSRAMISQLKMAFGELEQDSSIRRITITANGRYFSTGADLGTGPGAFGSDSE